MEENAWEGPLQEFRHAELDSNTCIRLVQIHAEFFRGDISCKLQHYESDTRTCPDYTAVSYAWGDSNARKTVYINGLVYRVHQSLWDFLSHSRTKDTEHTWLWADFLCIDQAHHSEKNVQIPRMGDIYAQAACVTSWLGNHGETVEALRVLVKISEEIDTECTPQYAWKSSESEQIHKACDQLGFREPYWSRVWVIQEVACARNCIVACGDASVNFEDLLHKMEIVMESSVRFDASADRDRRMKRIKALADLKTSIQQGKTIKILELIKKTLFCQATRGQDRIYGLLGLARQLDPGFDSSALEVSQQKTLVDVCWDLIFMVSDGGSNINIKNDMAALQNLIERLAPPRKHWEVEIGSSIRRDQAETASQVSKAAYSSSVQAFVGLLYSHREHDATLRSRQQLQKAWDMVTQHVYDHDHDVSGMQTRLGWSTYAGLRFTSWHYVENDFPETLADSLPLGWLCAAHLPDPASKTTAKHRIMHTFLITAPPEDRSHPAYCSGAENEDARCDLSLVVLRIEKLGVTCLVRSADTVQIDFYCDCCDPSTASVEPPHDEPWLSRSSSPARRFISCLESEEFQERRKRARARGHEMRGRRELRRIGNHNERLKFKRLSLSESESDEEYWTAPSSPK